MFNPYRRVTALLQSVSLPLQFIIIVIVGITLLTLQFGSSLVDAFSEKRQIEELSIQRAEAALDMLVSVHTQAMINRKQTEDGDAAIATLNGSMEQFSQWSRRVELWVVMGPKVTAYQERNNNSEREPPHDAIDEEVVRNGNTVTREVGNKIRISRPAVMGRGPASNPRCAACHTARMNIQDGEVIGAYAASVDMSPEMAAWKTNFLRNVSTAFGITLVTMGIVFLLLRVTVLSPIHKLVEITRKLAQGNLNATVQKSGFRSREIDTMFSAMALFLQSLRINQELETKNATAHETVKTLSGQLNLALDSMSQGLCLFDHSERLVMANRRFYTIFGISSESLPNGTSFSEVCRKLAVAALGNAAESQVEELGTTLYRRNKAVLESFLECCQREEILGDRYITLTHSHTVEGGWVTTFEDVTQRREADAKIVHMARFDALTGLPNRSNFAEHIEREVEWGAQYTEKFAVVSIDLDKFKEINDERGHLVGDRVLQEISARMAAVCEETDFVSRSGGDEFVATMRLDGDRQAQKLVSRIESCFDDPVAIDDASLRIGFSMGVAIFPADGKTADELLNNADLAMYRAKKTPDVNCCYYMGDMDEAHRRRWALAKEIASGLDAGEFYLAYQVQKSVMTGETIGYEALIRWRHPKFGLVSPAEFIPIAEKNGSILKLGHWVLRNACRDAAAWLDETKVAINVSPVQLQRSNLVQLVHEALLETGINAKRIELELTESTIISDKHKALNIMRQLKALGVNVVLDDFGTGFSSLETLHAFPFDKIKIDRSFLMSSDDRVRSLSIIRGIMAISQILKIPVLAEGVETEEDLELLRREGCQEAQGFLFGRPDVITSVRKAVDNRISLAVA